MVKEIGHVRELVRYPVKSMAGIPMESAFLGWSGLAGDRRFGFRRLGVDNGFPWLTGCRLSELLLYQPFGLEAGADEPLPTHVRTPAGRELELRSAELQSEIGERLGSAVELMQLKHGIFDAAPISVISLATIAGIGREVGADLDRRRFRANIFLETYDREVFLEDKWVGGTLVFGPLSGGGEPRPAVNVALRDERCGMIAFDPDTVAPDPRVLKAVVRMNGNHAGIYATVVQTGTIRAGDPVSLVRSFPVSSPL